VCGYVSVHECVYVSVVCVYVCVHVSVCVCVHECVCVCMSVCVCVNVCVYCGHWWLSGLHSELLIERLGVQATVLA